LVHIQTFFTGPKGAIRYFYVTITTSNGTNTTAASSSTELATGTGAQGGQPGGVKDDELVAGSMSAGRAGRISRRRSKRS
jgi:hypothetical protein